VNVQDATIAGDVRLFLRHDSEKFGATARAQALHRFTAVLHRHFFAVFHLFACFALYAIPIHCILLL
jgi:preprotein translocase subunit SecG